MSLADALTLSRAVFAVPVALALAFFLDGGSSVPFIVLYLAAFATDCLDGKAARSKGTCTERGAKMDVLADLLVAGASAIVLAMHGQLHLAYIILMVLQFSVFFRLSHVRLEYDCCGRIAG